MRARLFKEAPNRAPWRCAEAPWTGTALRVAAPGSGLSDQAHGVVQGVAGLGAVALVGVRTAKVR